MLSQKQRLYRELDQLCEQLENHTIPLLVIFSKWRGIRRKIKKLWQLEPPLKASRYFMIDNAVKRITNRGNLANSVSYYSDRWCRGRMYSIDRAFKKLLDDSND